MTADRPYDLLFFLKLGGSLITDKSRPHTPLPGVIRRLSEEIASACQENPQPAPGRGPWIWLLWACSGSQVGYPSRSEDSAEWAGFIEVWREASALNRLVVDELAQAGIPALPFSPLSAILAEDGDIIDWNLAPLRAALDAGLVPVVQGDAVFDRQRGGTILSTEQLFQFLARQFRPQKILLAGIEKGVWADFPACTRLVEVITPENYAGLGDVLSGSTATDVTGGMLSKVAESLDLVEAIPGLEVVIFSGAEPGVVKDSLGGQASGTRICSDRTGSPAA